MISSNSPGPLKKYYFEEVTVCEMCGDKTMGHIVMGQRLNQSQGFSVKKKTGIAVSVKKCTKCELIYPSPLPIPFDIQDHYGTPPEEYWQPSDFEWQPTYFSSQIAIVKELLPFDIGMKALDIGVGLGKCMRSLNNAGFDAYGFEPSVPFYERAITRMEIDPSHLKLGMIEDMEYPEESFDFITFGAVFEHLYHPAGNLKKALKWLKPDGIIQIEVPSSKHFVSRLINLFYRLTGTNYVTNLSPMHSPFHLYEFGLKSFQEAGKRMNFSIVKHYYDVCSIHPIPSLFDFPVRKYMQWKGSGMQLTVYLKKQAFHPIK